MGMKKVLLIEEDLYPDLPIAFKNYKTNYVYERNADPIKFRKNTTSDTKISGMKLFVESGTKVKGGFEFSKTEVAKNLKYVSNLSQIKFVKDRIVSNRKEKYEESDLFLISEHIDRDNFCVFQIQEVLDILNGRLLTNRGIRFVETLQKYFGQTEEVFFPTPSLNNNYHLLTGYVQKIEDAEIIIERITTSGRNSHFSHNYTEGTIVPLNLKPIDILDVFNADDSRRIINMDDMNRLSKLLQTEGGSKIALEIIHQCHIEKSYLQLCLLGNQPFGDKIKFLSLINFTPGTHVDKIVSDTENYFKRSLSLDEKEMVADFYYNTEMENSNIFNFKLQLKR